jgi:hypothetical protein
MEKNDFVKLGMGLIDFPRFHFPWAWRIVNHANLARNRNNSSDFPIFHGPIIYIHGELDKLYPK